MRSHRILIVGMLAWLLAPGVARAGAVSAPGYQQAILEKVQVLQGGLPGGIGSLHFDSQKVFAPWYADISNKMQYRGVKSVTLKGEAVILYEAARSRQSYLDRQVQQSRAMITVALAGLMAPGSVTTQMERDIEAKSKEISNLGIEIAAWEVIAVRLGGLKARPDGAFERTVIRGTDYTVEYFPGIL